MAALQGEAASNSATLQSERETRAEEYADFEGDRERSSAGLSGPQREHRLHPLRNRQASSTWWRNCRRSSTLFCVMHKVVASNAARASSMKVQDL